MFTKELGRGGKDINILKFRTMRSNADEYLRSYLETRPKMKAEWETYHKLKNDVRITRVGKFLRRLSLDELPQLWNVLKGEMSLVGPRPIVQKEVTHYGATFNAYKQVLPGLTGLWQISGRNELKFSQRKKLDEYYIYNWSIWMDAYILLHTIFAVINGKGAY